jgi:hypothetical protein
MSNLVHTGLQDGVAVLTIYADTIGQPVVLRRVEDYRARLGDHWKPAPLLARLAAEGRGFYDSPSSVTPP